MNMEETTLGSTHVPPSTGAPNRTRAVLVGGGVVALLALAALLLAPRHAVEVARKPGFTVNGDRIAINAGAPAWSYVELAQATLGAPLPPKPVPGHVAVDEALSEQVLAPLTGRVESVSARLGQRVEKGDRLATVRSVALVDLSKEIDQLRREESAKAQTLQRVRSLVAVRAVPEKDLVAAEQEFGQAQLAREAAELKLRSLEVQPGSEALYGITAQRGGVVVERNVLPGQEVGPERGDPLMVIADLDEVIVTADVPEVDVGDLQLGQEAQITSASFGGRELGGRVEYISEVVDPQRRMVNVRVRVPNPERLLRPNAYVQVAFAPVGEPRVVVPAGAVVTDDQESVVFVRSGGEGGPLERRPVVTGHQRTGQVEITSGLTAGETYVTRGAILLLNAVDLERQ
jgi:membrane fusion protein, heavy metal efflux system